MKQDKVSRATNCIKWHVKIISKIQLIENKEVTLLVKLNR